MNILQLLSLLFYVNTNMIISKAVFFIFYGTLYIKVAFPRGFVRVYRPTTMTIFFFPPVGIKAQIDGCLKQTGRTGENVMP